MSTNSESDKNNDGSIPDSVPTTNGGGLGKFEQNKDYTNLQDFTASYFGFNSFNKADPAGKYNIKNFLDEFFSIAGNVDNVIRNIEQGTLTPKQKAVLDRLLDNPSYLQVFVENYVDVIDFDYGGLAKDDNTSSELSGYSIFKLLNNVYAPYKASLAQQKEATDPFDYIQDQIKQMGDFNLTFDHLDTHKKITEIYLRPGKFREDNAPESIQSYQVRIGGSTFFIPPTNINVYQGFKSTSFGNGNLRQPNSSKANLGHSETHITMTLYFPNHESIWGFAGDQAGWTFANWDPKVNVNGPGETERDTTTQNENLVSDQTIDYYLSSLRGLVTQFRYAPFLPVRSDYLNRTFGIDAVTMMGMTVSTVENYPFVLAVNLELGKFNYSPFLPMITDFDQAIHWGKYRQYMGKAAARLDSKVNQGFLIEKQKPYRDDTGRDSGSGGSGGIPGDNGVVVGEQGTAKNTVTYYEGDLEPRLDKVADLADGRNFDFYYPITTPSRIFAPDTTDFRQPGEDDVVTKDEWDFILSDIGLDVREAPSFSFFDYDKQYRQTKYRSQRRVLQAWLKASTLTWNTMNSVEKKKFIDAQIKAGRDSGKINDNNEASIRQQYNNEWFNTVYDGVLLGDPIFQALKAARDAEQTKYTINEWQVPMDKLAMDWTRCIVTGVTVSLSNNFAKMQIQLQDEPTYQHLGGGDSQVNVNMIVIGEENLIRFRRLFDHVNGLARLEKVHGVLGFLGIKNVITSLCGIKYVLPIDFEVDTLPNYPHVYSVKMSFVDFDVMQQEREKLSSAQQSELNDLFGKRNPFLRLKQVWSAFNAYPDLPLDVRDDDGKMVGHLDPDWYFRSFNTTRSDSDIFSWGFDSKVSNIIKDIAELQIKIDGSQIQNRDDAVTVAQWNTDLKHLEEEVRQLVANGAQIPAAWKIDDQGKVAAAFTNGDLPEPEMVHYLGVYAEDKTKVSFLAFFEGGYFALGEQDINTGKREYSLGMSVFGEDLATTNIKDIGAGGGLTPLSQYQKEYLDSVTNPNQQYEAIMQDYNYRNQRGRMLRAFPTYMLWLIDEGGRFAGIKLFDNFYGLNSVIDFSVVSSEDAIGDTMIMRLSNIYNKLTTPYKEEIISEDDPLFGTAIGQWIQTAENRQRNLESGLTNTILDINNIRLKPGVRIHLRMGYSGNPNALQTVFNGVIAEVEPGEIMTITCQSDAVELTGYVNTVNAKGSSGTIDGGINTGFWLSEPRDLIVRLLTMGSSNFKEWMAWGSKGVIFSESRFGIRHFGSILYEPMTSDEKQKQKRVTQNVTTEAVHGPAKSGVADFDGLLGGAAQELSEVTSITGLPGALSSNMIKIGRLLWLNQFSKRDYELYKRNIYPGNGSGIAQFMGGDQIDGGIAISTASAFYAKDSGASAYYKQSLDRTTDATTVTGRVGSPSINSDHSTSSEDLHIGALADKNASDAAAIWSTYYNISGATEDEVVDILSNPTKGATDLNVKENSFFSGDGLLDDLISVPVSAFKGLDAINDFLYDLPGGSVIAPVLTVATGVGIPVAALGFASHSGLLSGAARLAAGALNPSDGGGNGLGFILGLTSAMTDDDLKGFDEVSFRAQTYMKTVWDLFKVCAALLPNYIIAVRPFEDRSTVFYGKPHWLYTSGVIPITTGIAKDSTAAPFIEGSDATVTSLLNEASKSASNEIQRMNETIDKTNSIKDIMALRVGKDIDPNAVGGSTSSLSTKDQVDAILASEKAKLAKAETNDTVEDAKTVLDAVTDAIQGIDLSGFTYQELTVLLTIAPESALASTGLYAGELSVVGDTYRKRYGFQNRTQVTGDIDNFNVDFAPLDTDQLVATYTKIAADAKARVQTAAANAQDKAPKIIGDSAYDKAIIEGINQFASTDADRQRLLDFYRRDPITFAYQFGWRISSVPVWIDPTTGYGVDSIGDEARKAYDEGYSIEVNALGNKRSVAEGIDIWRDFREHFGGEGKVTEIYNKYFPLPEEQAKFQSVLDLFMRFLWQDPYNRAWLISIVDKTGDGIGDLTNQIGSLGLGDNSNHWSWSKVFPTWEAFVSNGDVEVDDDNVVHAASARRYMEQHQTAGKDAHNFFAGVTEDVTEWFDENIGQVIGLVTDTISGFVSSIRLSLMQMGNAVSQAGDQQRSANILNAAFNDSIYYAEGTEGSMLRLVDNPFTREYGEPVIEVREPFQRIHFISSFDSIIDNKITENLNGVATVITAVSDGKYPVTVHFDKGVSPERQVERVVETNLLWDNAVGSGLFGFLQPLLHPLESIRGYTKTATGSSDQLSARRVALYHLKNSLKNIYMGEIIIMGNADIRTHDLLYIADIYERMYGMVEVQQVIHHFTPETGFVTAITPNALVTVNDPARWSLLAYAWSKMSNYNLRDDVRAMMNIKADRSSALATQEILNTDVYKYFGTQMNGSVQYTSGNSALIRDLGATFTGGGIQALTARDKVYEKVEQIEVGLGLLKAGATIAGALVGTAIAPGVGTIALGTAGWAVTDLAWQGWKWVKDNLLDQHGCYIQYLNKDGQPMDAGLSYFQGVAVGSNHTINLFPGIMGLNTKVNVQEDGHYRITTNDLLGSLGWTEVETVSLYKDTSMFVNNINANILKIAGRDPALIPNDNFIVVKARLLDLDGEKVTVNGRTYTERGIEDADTVWVKVLESSGNYAAGQAIDIRFASFNAYELEYHDDTSTSYDETKNNPDNDLARIAFDYLSARFSKEEDRTVALRIDKRNEKDKYGRTLATIFHNAPLGTAGSQRLDILAGYAGNYPPIPFDSYLDDGRPYTLNWEMVMTGYGNVDMRESLWDTNWRKDATNGGIS